MSKLKVALLIPLKIIDKQKFVWMQKRESKDFLYGKLEFVGGKVNPGEDLLEACVRETKEEISIDIKKSDLVFFNTYKHFYSDFIVELHCFIQTQDLKDFNSDGWIEISPESVNELAGRIPEANIAIINDLCLM